MTVALNAAQVWAASLTDAAIAQHLRRLTENPRFFGKSQREALLTEAAQRFDGIRKCPGCNRVEQLSALSRFDNRTLICSSCGVNEGMAFLPENRGLATLLAPGRTEWAEAKR